MKNKNNSAKILILIAAICVFLNMYANANNDRQFDKKAKTEFLTKKPNTNPDSVALVSKDTTLNQDLVQERAVNLFKDRILLEFLYDNTCDRNTKIYRYKALVPEAWSYISDNRYSSIINYGVLSSNQGDEDAKMFWAIIKSTMTNKGNTTDLNKNDTIVNTSVNENLDTVVRTYIFGGKYIDVNNKYVAKYITEIKQICEDMRRIKEAEMRKSAIEQKQMNDIKTQSK